MSTTAELPTAAASPSWTRRVIAFPLTRILLGTVAVVAAAMAPEAIIHSWVAKPYRGLWPEILAAAVALLAYRWIVRRFGRREATELAHSRAVPELAAGIGLGFVLVGGVIAVLAATGAYQLQHVSPWSFAIIKPLGEMVLAGTLEELVFRGILFRITERALGTWPALAISSILFALAHIPGSGAPTMLALGTIVVASVLLSAAYLMTRRLWLCIGIHIGWNYTLGSIWSIAVSGHKVDPGLLIGQLTGPDWLTGGAYGLEGSLIALVILAIAGAIILQRAVAGGAVLRRNAASPRAI
jgi:membrane protease YdiL (CAAX protease family)